MNSELVELARSFARSIAELVRRDIARQVLNGHGELAKNKPKARRSKRREVDQADGIQGKLLRVIHDGPGQRVEEIGRALSLPTSELKGPLRELVAARVLRTTGKARGTRYFERAGTRKRR